MQKTNYEQHREIDHIYYNGELFNESFNKSIPAEISDVLNSEIIKEGSQYNLSVIRLGVSGHFLPIFNILPDLLSVINNTPIVPPYITAYSVSLSLGPNTQTTPVEYFPITTDQNLLFNIYTYQHFLDCINSAYLKCYNDFNTAHGGALAAKVNQSPYLYYDSTTNLISMYVESGYNLNMINPIGVFMNNLLFDFFDSLEYLLLNSYNSPNGTDIQLNITSENCINLSPLQPGNPAILSSWALNAGQSIWQLRQQYPSVYSWNIVESLILVTSIGVNSENIPFSSGQGLHISNSSISALTDVTSNLNPTNNTGSRSFLQYFPTAEYRVCNITNSSRIQNISLGLYYRDFRGELNKLFLNPRYAMSVKLLFRRKGLLSFK